MGAAHARAKPAVNQAELGRTLLALARSAIGAKLGLAEFDEARCASLMQPSATFVTLRKAGELRGCIGSLEPIRPLGLDVRENAIAAAFQDPRFDPLAVAEFAQTSIEISLLSPPEAIEAGSETELLARIRPGIDGLAIDCGGSRATLLPQVWSMCPEPRRFLAVLRQKAGLAENYWSPAIRVSRFSVVKWAERGFAPGGASS
jgi:AmmeMemoRadiSam system protein A